MTGAVIDISAAVRGAERAPDFFEGGGSDGGSPRYVLPPGAPIHCLGKQGLTLFLLDHAHQLQALKPRELGKGELIAICGDSEWLVANFAAYGKPEKNGDPPPVVGFNQAKAQEAIIMACSAKPIFSPQGSLFGRGAHRRTADDALVLHIGTKVLMVGVEDRHRRKSITIDERPSGLVDGKIYPALPALPPPAPMASSPDEAKRLRAMLGKWYFADGDIATLLVLGWIGQAMICGASAWRSHIWLTGETAAGKSTLQKLIRAILDAWALYTEDASEAAVRQMLGDDTLPVMIDEAEADDRAERQTAMVNLARKASSGAKILRGSADHQAKEFTAQSAFLFSSILHSPLDPQDRNRFAILAMRQIPSDAPEPNLELRYWREAGRRLHRRMIEGWPRFDATVAEYKEEIRLQGFQGRWRDTFGTLLACADLLLYDVLPSAESELNEGYGRRAQWVAECVPLMDRGSLEAEDTTTRCIRKLTSTLLPAIGGQHQEGVGTWLARAMKFDTETQTFDTRARAKLMSHGMRVVNLTKTPRGGTGVTDATYADQVYVLVASGSNAPMRELFAGSKWHGGGWSQALAHARYDPEARPAVLAKTGIRNRFSGSNDWAVAVPIEAMIGPLGQAAVG